MPRLSEGTPLKELCKRKCDPTPCPCQHLFVSPKNEQPLQHFTGVSSRVGSQCTCNWPSSPTVRFYMYAYPAAGVAYALFRYQPGVILERYILISASREPEHLH